MSAVAFFIRAVVLITLALGAGILLGIAQRENDAIVRRVAVCAMIIALAVAATLFRQWVIL